MENKYLRTQNDLADIIIDRIDKYWKMELHESLLIDEVMTLISTNEDLFYKDGQYTAIIRHKLGKKRLMLVEKILREKKEVGE